MMAVFFVQDLPYYLIRFLCLYTFTCCLFFFIAVFLINRIFLLFIVQFSNPVEIIYASVVHIASLYQ